MSSAPEAGTSGRSRREPAWRRSWAGPGIRRPLWPALGLAALVAWLFRGPLFGSGVFFERDIHMMWYGQVESLVRSVAQGAWPVWDPWIGFGRPLWANANNQVLYPLTWLNLLMRPWTYYTLFVVLHSLLSGIGMLALVRRLGGSRAGAFVAAAVWLTSGPWLSLVSVWNHLSGAAWLPWALLAADRSLGSGRVGPALLWGVTLAAPILAGSPDLFVMILLCTLLWLSTRLRRPLLTHPLNRSAARALLLAALFAAGLAAGQWLPTLELARVSARWQLPVEARLAWSLHPWGLLETVLPFRWAELPLKPALLASLLELRGPWLRSIYLGAPCVALGAASLAARRPGSRFFAALGASAALMALGRHFPGFEPAAQLFPPLASLRFPVKAMVLAAFCWSVLAGTGFDAWRDSAAVSRRRWSWMVSLPVGVVACACGTAALLANLGAERWGPELLYRGPGFPSFSELLRPAASALAIAAGLAGAALALSIARTRLATSGTLALLVAALSVGDLLATHDKLNPLAPRSLYTNRPEVLDQLATDRHQRLYVRDHAVLPKTHGDRPRRIDPVRLARAPQGWNALASLHLGMQMYLNPPTAGRFGVEGSYDLDLLDLYPAPLARLTEYLREVEGSPTHLRLLQMGAVANVLALHSEPWWQNLRLVTTVPGLFEAPIHVFQVPDPLPRTYAVGGARLATGEAALAALANPQLDLRREVILSEAREMQGAADPFSGTSRVVERRPDRVRIEAELSRPGFVVLVDGYDPGWRAEIDGRAAHVLRANIAFRAVAVPAGRHVVEYRYRPTSVAVGAAISALTLLLGLGHAAIRLVR